MKRICWSKMRPGGHKVGVGRLILRSNMRLGRKKAQKGHRGVFLISTRADCIPQKIRKCVSAQNVYTYTCYPLKIVIFRARFFKAQHAMVSNEIAYLYFLGCVSSPHRDDQYPPTIRNHVSAQNVLIIPLKSCYFSSSFSKGPTCHGFERCRCNASFRRVAMRIFMAEF